MFCAHGREGAELDRRSLSFSAEGHIRRADGSVQVAQITNFQYPFDMVRKFPLYSDSMKDYLLNLKVLYKNKKKTGQCDKYIAIKKFSDSILHIILYLFIRAFYPQPS
jgi:hypothetical protein